MIQISKLAPGEQPLDELVHFVGALNRDEAHQIGYLDADPAQLAKMLLEHEHPPHASLSGFVLRSLFLVLERGTYAIKPGSDRRPADGLRHARDARRRWAILHSHPRRPAAGPRGVGEPARALS